MVFSSVAYTVDTQTLTGAFDDAHKALHVLPAGRHYRVVASAISARINVCPWISLKSIGELFQTPEYPRDINSHDTTEPESGLRDNRDKFGALDTALVVRMKNK